MLKFSYFSGVDETVYTPVGEKSVDVDLGRDLYSSDSTSAFLGV